MKTTKRVWLILTTVLLLLVAGVAVALPSSRITWNPDSLMTESVVPGEEMTTRVTFTASKNAKNVDVWVVPELASYVSVSPTFFASLSEGTSYSVDLTISAPNDMVIGVYDGTIHLRHGAKWTLARPLPVEITFSPITLPPDPGEAGKLTIEGIDSDGDGVRDDVQRWIGFNAYTSESGHAALMQSARALQEFLTAEDENARITAAHAQDDAGQCLYFVRGDGNDADAAELASYLRVEMLNTRERSEEYIDGQRALNGQRFPSRIDEWQYKCDFDPWIMDT